MFHVQLILHVLRTSEYWLAPLQCEMRWSRVHTASLPLQHVLKDKRVLALVQKKAAELEGEETHRDWDMKEIVTYVSVVCVCEGRGGCYNSLSPEFQKGHRKKFN